MLVFSTKCPGLRLITSMTLSSSLVTRLSRAPRQLARTKLVPALSLMHIWQHPLAFVQKPFTSMTSVRGVGSPESASAAFEFQYYVVSRGTVRGRPSSPSSTTLHAILPMFSSLRGGISERPGQSNSSGLWDGSRTEMAASASQWE